MSRAPHLCGCGRVVAYGTRCKCQIASTRARNRRYDATRPNARDRGYDAQWQAARREWLQFNPCCAMCKATATTVDHIKPHRGDKALFWDRHNWQSLCTCCHNRHKQRIEQRK